MGFHRRFFMYIGFTKSKDVLPGFDFFYERAWEKMASENVHVSLLVPNELDAALRALHAGPYAGKPLADIYRLMLWRGLGRTEELLKEREEMGGLAK